MLLHGRIAMTAHVMAQVQNGFCLNRDSARDLERGKRERNNVRVFRKFGYGLAKGTAR